MPFNPHDFIARIARRLVNEFEDAAAAGTPGLIGASRETPARRQLERLLPGYVAVGSGIVIDATGGASRQEDIVLHERFESPVYSINETPEATFYPVEGVIAVGEVKSALNGNTMRDALEKIASAKRLSRYAESRDHGIGIGPSVDFRTYGMRGSFAGAQSEQFSPDKWQDQVFGFVLCRNFSIAPQTILDHIRDARLSPHHLPNAIVSLESGLFVPFNPGNNTLEPSMMTCSSYMHSMEIDKAFPYLVERLIWISRHGRTVPSEAFNRYLRPRALPLQLNINVHSQVV